MKATLLALGLFAFSMAANAKIDNFGSLIEESAKTEKSLKNSIQKQLQTSEAGTIKKSDFKGAGEAFLGDKHQVENVAVESTGEFSEKELSPSQIEVEQKSFKRLADELQESR